MIRIAVAAAAAWLLSAAAAAQTLQHRGFVESRAFLFPQDALLDRQNLVIDVLAREELLMRPADWLQFAAGVDFRANSADQVEADAFDIADRRTRRPMLSVRRLAATAHRGPLTVDAGKQFIRWGKTDIVTPTDRFAPRDFLNVIDSEFLAVRGARAVIELAPHTIDVVWVPFFTPSRLPLPSKRWVVLPAEAPNPPEQQRVLPDRSQWGIRWSVTASAIEYSVSYFDGLNHLPVVDPLGPAQIALRFPALRMYGGDAAVPTGWMTIKAEAAYFAARDRFADDYLLYVVQLERLAGEWVLIGGYAGEVVTERRAFDTFAPDRGTAHSIIARASYTLTANRSVAFETAVREDAAGLYVKAEYSQAYGNHWRVTFAGAAIGGDRADFLGQYRRNSHLIAGARYSF
jgi:hypothetical protein